MSLDLETLRQAVQTHGRVTRVVIAAIRGSSPREVGAAMLVWDGGQSGTIGGGALEFEAARRALRTTTDRVLSTHALGPELGQCCGGSVTLLQEVFTTDTLPSPENGLFTRPVTPQATELQPLALRRMLSRARNQGLQPEPQLVDGWMVEPIYQPQSELWIWGAGHVGRALVDVLSPLPDLAITWVDTARERFPDDIPANVTCLPAADPALLMRHVSVNAQHLVLTYSHELDLALCHALLNHGFSFAGLIGSATKWARFRSRLAALGHAPVDIARITCPIGDPALGKHPQMIAVGVAADLLRRDTTQTLREDRRA